MAVPPLWRAVHALREAEALTGLGTVTGPLDAPPERAEDQDSWARDWLTRAKDALKRAREMHDQAAQKGGEVLKERAARVADKLRSGARAVLEGAQNMAKATRDELGKFHDTAQSAFGAWASMNVLFTVLGLIGLFWYFKRSK